MKGIIAVAILAFGCHSDAPAIPATATPSAAPVVRPRAPAPPPASSEGPLEDPRGELERFYRALRKAENKEPGGRVLIAQFGDSHTASDGLTRRMRHRLQKRFGDAGRGWLLPGKPLRHYYQRDCRYGSSGTWKAEKSWRRSATPPYGIGGVRVHSKKSDAEVFVGSCKRCELGAAVNRFEIFFARAPKAGTLRYRIDDGRWSSLRTAGDEAVAHHLVEAPGERHRLTLKPRGDGDVHLFGVALERTSPGVIVDGLGVSGLRAVHLERRDWKVVGAQLRLRDPRLVVLQYGTNEAYNTSLDLAELEQRYVELVGRIRKAVPAASILILGPPDVGMRALPYQVCKKWKRERAKKVASALAKQQEPAPPDEEKAQGCRYQTPAVLLEIVAAQRNAARKTGVAFFDTLGAMGGTQMMDAFHDRELAYGDRVHFTREGASWWADLLLDHLIGTYDRWNRATAREAGATRTSAAH